MTFTDPSDLRRAEPLPPDGPRYGTEARRTPPVSRPAALRPWTFCLPSPATPSADGGRDGDWLGFLEAAPPAAESVRRAR